MDDFTDELDSVILLCYSEEDWSAFRMDFFFGVPSITLSLFDRQFEAPKKSNAIVGAYLDNSPIITMIGLWEPGLVEKAVSVSMEPDDFFNLYEYLLVGAKQFTYSIKEGAIRHVPLPHMTPVFLEWSKRMNRNDPTPAQKSSAHWLAW